MSPELIARNERLIEAYKAGAPLKDIAAQFGLCLGQVRRILRPYWVSGALSRRGPDLGDLSKARLAAAQEKGRATLKARGAAGLYGDFAQRQAVLKALESGLTFSEVAARVGCSRSAVAGIKFRAGLCEKAA